MSGKRPMAAQKRDKKARTPKLDRAGRGTPDCMIDVAKSTARAAHESALTRARVHVRRCAAAARLLRRNKRAAAASNARRAALPCRAVVRERRSRDACMHACARAFLRRTAPRCIAMYSRVQSCTAACSWGRARTARPARPAQCTASGGGAAALHPARVQRRAPAAHAHAAAANGSGARHAKAAKRGGSGAAAGKLAAAFAGGAGLTRTDTGAKRWRSAVRQLVV
eukprot:IDg1166t1